MGEACAGNPDSRAFFSENGKERDDYAQARAASAGKCMRDSRLMRTIYGF